MFWLIGLGTGRVARANTVLEAYEMAGRALAPRIASEARSQALKNAGRYGSGRVMSRLLTVPA